MRPLTDLATDVTESRKYAREIKFLIDPARAAEIRDWACAQLNPDPYAASGDTYRTTTLYFDTPEFAVYQRRGSYGRSKYRVRRYGASDDVFLERKLRTNALVSKDRLS